MALNFDVLQLPSLQLDGIDQCFTEEEIWKAILDTPADKAPGPDGFTGLFYRTAWPIIKADIMAAFNALWSLDGRSFYLVNQAYMILLKKKSIAQEVSDYRPISLVHSFAKLAAKVLATRVAPFLQSLVKPNQSAFIRGRFLHDNFRAVQLTARLLHKQKQAAALLKIDITKAFDTVNWTFLLAVLKHMGFPSR